MSIQPGTGLSFTQSGSGTTLNIDKPWTPAEVSNIIIAEDLGLPFQVTMSGNDVKVVKGQVIAPLRLGLNLSEATRQYSVTGFGVYPDGSNGSLTVGTDSASPYASSGGYVTIKNAADGGADYWGVYLIRNQDDSYSGQYGIPYLAVMAVDSDAYVKSTPWLGGIPGTADDALLVKNCFTYIPQTIYDDPNPPVSVKAYVSLSPATYNYNCQRIVLATMWWVDGSWHVFQEFIGDVTMPGQVYFGGQVEYDPDGPYPLPWADWPLYSSEQSLYLGTWTDYGKDPTASFMYQNPFA